MSLQTPSKKFQFFQLLAISIAVVLALFAWEGAKGLNFWDEGFFWYGVQRVTHGEMPLRDFQAYDPFRYYWSAALLSLWGNSGIVALRATGAVLQAVGLFLGLLAIATAGTRARRNSLGYFAVAAVTLGVWMIPHFKMTDLTASLLLIWVLTWLIDAPTARRYLITGICVGFSAFMGRNHGVYSLVAIGAAILWLSLNRTQGPGLLRGVLLFALGVGVGFLPVVAMLLLAPGFAVAYWESIRLLFEVKATNIGLPVPWPWHADFSGSLEAIVRDVTLGLFFIATLVFGVLALLWVVWRRWRRQEVQPAFAAAAFLALPYAHYAFSRADFYHLALGIFPLLVGCFALALPQRAPTRWLCAGALLAVSVLTMYSYHAGWECRAGGRCVDAEISGSRMQIDPVTANEVDLVRRLVAQYAANGRSFVVAPLWPGAYALMDRKSPMWESYALFQRGPEFEQSEIALMKAADPGFALIYDLPLDGDEQLRFKNSRPLTYAYFSENFVRVPNPLRPDLEVFVAKANPGLAAKPEFLQKSAAELSKLANGAAKLRVLNWGPRSTPAGTVPNAQPDGSAGIWIQVADAEDVGDVRVLFDGLPASVTGVAPGSITAAVPAARFTMAGNHEVAIEQVATGKSIAVGSFSVTPK